MPMSNRTYDWGKWLCLIFLPALAVLLSGLSEVYHWPWGPDLVTTLNLLGVFIGSCLQVSSRMYEGE